jgi:cysteine desulfurase
MSNKPVIYFDNAATTPLHPKVADAMHEIMLDTYGNPSSIHGIGRKAKGVIEEARVSIAKHLGCLTSEIYFTSGGTESDNIAIRKGVHCLGVKNVITSPVEHHAVLSTAEEVVAENDDTFLHLLDIDSQGNINLKQLESLLKEHKNCMVSLMHANNELGNLNDLAKIGSLCHEHNAYFHTDAVQTVGYFDFNINDSNIDMLSASAHKFNGPKGIGFIYIKKGIPINALITGGGQERSLRAGTESVCSILGMSKALDLCYENLPAKSSKISIIRSYFIEQIKEHIPEVQFNGDIENSHYTVISVSLPATKSIDMLLFSLDLQGICASGGSACSSGASKGSHVLEAINAPSDRINIRFSFGIYNTKQEVDDCIASLKSLI